jgi:hypothetical protein
MWPPLPISVCLYVGDKDAFVDILLRMCARIARLYVNPIFYDTCILVLVQMSAGMRDEYGFIKALSLY